MDERCQKVADDRLILTTSPFLDQVHSKPLTHRRSGCAWVRAQTEPELFYALPIYIHLMN